VTILLQPINTAPLSRAWRRNTPQKVPEAGNITDYITLYYIT